MNFIVTQDNLYADKLASIGLDTDNLTIWTDLPTWLNEYYVKNRLGMPNYRFSNF